MHCKSLHSDSDPSLLYSLTKIDDINIFELTSLEIKKIDPKLVLIFNYLSNVVFR